MNNLPDIISVIFTNRLLFHFQQLAVVIWVAKNTRIERIKLAKLTALAL
jgi:hypothetical protein